MEEENLLPKPQTDLPLPEAELPAHAESTTSRPLPVVDGEVKGNKLKFFILAILAILILGSIAFGAYVMGKQSTPQMAEQTASTPSPTPDPTADWQTYTSDCGFTIKFPNNMTARKDFRDSPNAGVNQCADIFNKDTKIVLEGYDNLLITINRTPLGEKVYNSPVNSLSEYVKAYSNGQPVMTVYKIFGNNEGVLGEFPGAGSDFTYIFKNGEYIYHASWQSQYYNPDTQNIINNILSSIRFTNSNNPITTADWQKYNNSEYNFSLKYPNDWKATTVTSPEDETIVYISSPSYPSGPYVWITKEKSLPNGTKQQNVGGKEIYLYYMTPGRDASITGFIKSPDGEYYSLSLQPFYKNQSLTETDSGKMFTQLISTFTNGK